MDTILKVDLDQQAHHITICFISYCRDPKTVGRLGFSVCTRQKPLIPVSKRFTYQRGGAALARTGIAVTRVHHAYTTEGPIPCLTSPTS